MKTRYFVSDSYKLDDNVVGRELYLKHGAYYFKDGIVSNCVTFCVENQEYEIHITKVEEMELSDFIADGRTKYELNGIRFVVEDVFSDGIYVKMESTKCITELCGLKEEFNVVDDPSVECWNVFSRNSINAHMYHSHIEDVKLVTTSESCGKDEVMDNGKCYYCAMGGELMNNKMCEHDEIVYTSSQYVEAIEKEVPDAVNHPSHYTGAGIECIEAIKASMTPDALAGYLKGNVQKYLWRYEKKVNPVEDLKKARWYLDYLINEMEQTNV